MSTLADCEPTDVRAPRRRRLAAFVLAASLALACGLAVWHAHPLAAGARSQGRPRADHPALRSP